MNGSQDSIYKKFSNFKILGWSFFILCFGLAVIPSPSLSTKHFPIDRLFHVTAFFFLALAFREGYKKVPTYFIASMLGLAGATIEITQVFLPWRQASLGDLIADLVGIALVLIIQRKNLFIVWEITATVLYLGRSPIAPGTLTSLVVVLAYAFSPITNKALIFILIPLLLLSIWVSTLMEERYGHDPPRVTIDEAVGVLIALLFHGKSIEVYVWGFLLFRLFDIWKPFFVKNSQNLPGGLGIVIDDVLAGILANLGIVLISQVDKIIYVGLF